MNLIKGMLFSAVSLVAALGLQAATYYPVTIFYDPGEGKSIADFPVLVRIPVDSPIYAAAGTNGENLRFTDSLGVNDYPHEVDTWNASGESLVRVKIPELKKDFSFRLYCSGTDTAVAKDIWSAYAGVWHLNEALDSADKDYDPADGVTHTTQFYDCARVLSDGVLGKGLGSEAGVGAAFSSLVYDDRNGHKCPIAVSNPSKFTVSCWVRVQNVAAWTDLFGPVNQNGGQTGWKAEWTGNDSSKGMSLRMCQWGVNGDRLKNFSNIKPLLSGWHKLDAIWDVNSLILYVDGEPYGQKTDCPGVPTWFWTGRMGWGGVINADGTLPEFPAGTLDHCPSGTDFDECRIYNGVKSADRIAADYATVNDELFLSIGPSTEEQEIPEGTVAKVGPDYYQDFSEAVAASKASGNPLILMANGQSWTFMSEGESVSIKLGSSTFDPVNGLGAGYYLDTQYDSQTEVTTYTLMKQIVITAMRNVAVFKMLNTDDLHDLLPATVKGLQNDGTLAPGDYAVVWDTEKVSKYGCVGITQVYGLATVGGMKLPVTAFVRASVPYSDGYHDIAPELFSLSIKAPAVGDYPEITDPAEICGDSAKNIPTVTNGLAETAVAGNWNNARGFGSIVNSESKDLNPFLDVDMGWTEKHEIHRVEVFCTGGDNGTRPKGVELLSNGEKLNYVFTDVNGNPACYSRPWLGNAFNFCFDFATPVTLDQLTVRLEKPADARDHNPNATCCRILVWETGTGVDSLEGSTSAELAKLSFDGCPVGLTPGVYKYTVPHAAEVTAFAGEANVAVTVLPELNKIIRIVTLGEDGSSKIYTIRTGTGFSVILR